MSRKWVLLPLALAVAAGSCSGSTSKPSATGSGRSPSGSSAASNPVPRTLGQPGALAAGPRGVLFIADDSRNIIYARNPDGRITAVAGTGVRGFSGDGGRATDAQLNDPSGMVYDLSAQVLYVADTGNNRVRAISRSGRIRTVAGTGDAGWVTASAPANAANLTAPTAVTLSPRRRLYIAAGLEVLRLGPNGQLTRVAGTRHGAGISGAGGPAIRASTDSANGLAFDGAGNLYLTGSATKGLLVITPGGQMRVLCATCFYPRGNAGIVTAPSGAVIAMNTEKIYRYAAPSHRALLINFAGHKPVDGVTAIVPTGLAVTANGTIYFGTNGSGGFTNATTLMRLDPPGHLAVVWRRTPSQ